jgi:bifunctional DNA-binding transcriptional regulator/antitoxin component of YhaV-PrlF toxin-antitoxin module
MHQVSATTNAKVSHRGQTSLPAQLRHRWGLAAGGDIGVIDLGGAALIVPGGIDAARAELWRALQTDYEHGLAGLDDPDLVDQ